MKHQDIPAGSIHTPFNWTYADASTRLAATGFASGDVGKVALQSSDNTLWLLASTSPVWNQVTGKAAINPTGAWSSATAYNVGDLARYDDSLWYALQTSTNQVPAEDTYWTLFLADSPETGALLASNNLSDLASAATARTNLGLGNTAALSWVASETPSGTVNGSNTSFSLANAPGGSGAMMQLFLNGSLMDGGGDDYSISGSTITMVTVPQTGDKLRCSYWH